MTPRAYGINPGGVALSLATCVMFGPSISEDGWSQIARFAARDPGVRSGSASAGVMVPGLTSVEQQVFGVGREAF